MSQNTSRIGETAWSRNVSYVGSLLIIAAWTAAALTGCRFGNRVVKPASPENPDKITGLYDMEPKQISFVAQVSGNMTVGNNATGAPSLIAQYLTNPTALIMDNLETGEANFVNPYGDGKTGFPITVGADKSLALVDFELDPATLWTDPACIRKSAVSAHGALTEAEPHSVPGFTTKTSGRISLTVEYIEVYQGDCAPSLAEMSACYTDITACGGSTTAQNENRFEYVKALFQEYVDSQAITAADIAHLEGVGYEVQYE